MDNVPVYFYSKELMTTLADQSISFAGKVHGVVAESVEALQKIFGVEDIPLNPAEMFFEAVTKSNSGDVVLRVTWSLSQGVVSLLVINVSDGMLLGTATLRLASNRYNESYDRFGDSELKAKVSNWFDTLSRIDVNGVTEYGQIYQTADEAPAPTEAPSEVPHVEAEVVSEG